MKNLFLLLLLFCSIQWLNAQAPSKFRYQAVARDNSGTVITGNMDIRFSLLEDDANGTSRYTETHHVVTNAQGVFELSVGNGTIVSGNMDNVDWGNHEYWLKVEMKVTGASAFVAMGSSQLLSVPYAMYAAESGEHLLAGPGISMDNGVITNTGDLSDENELQTLSVNGNQLTISNGNTVTLPTGTTYTEGTGIDINGNSISALDASPTNEIQTLSLNGQQLSLSNGGGSVQLPAGNTSWASNGTTTYNNPTTNNVGIGTTNSTNSKLNVVASGNLWAGSFTSPAAADALHTYCNGAGAGIVAGSLNGTGGSFVSQTGTAGYFSSGSGKGLIVESGKVGIGTPNPDYKLDIMNGTLRVNGGNTNTAPTMVLYSYNGENCIHADANAGGTVAGFYADGGLGLLLSEDGPGGLGTGLKFNSTSASWNVYMASNKDFNLACNGVLKAWIYDTDGSYHNSSDSRLKKNIQPLNNVLEGISRLQAYTYRMKDAADDTPLSVGFMAQEVEQQFPELVAERDGYKSLCYDHFAVLSVQAIKEQQKEIEQQQIILASQQQQLISQASQIQDLQDELTQLKQLVHQIVDKK